MRQGNEFAQWGLVIKDRNPYIGVPLELVHDLADKNHITWRDNRDGTYTLIPRETHD